jgi:hypothetical protein
MDYENRSVDDVEITEDHKDFLMEAGASSSFDQLLSFDAAAAGVGRHSIRDQIANEIFVGDLDLTENPGEYLHGGSGFFQAMWAGDLFLAYRRGDPKNKSLMLACFGEDTIVNNGAFNHDDFDPEYIRTLVREPAL